MVNNDEKELEKRVLSRKNISEFDMECVKYNNLYLETYNYMKDKKLTENKLLIFDTTNLSKREQIKKIIELIERSS